MSVIAGMYYYQGSPVDLTALDRLHRALPHHDADGESDWVSGSIAVCYRPLHTTHESWTERQPLISASGHMLVMDGIIFNRPELLTLLANALQTDKSDAAILAAGLQKYGSGFLSRLVGDFALAWWDPTNYTLILARDAFGCRPLFYQLNTHGVMWSSHLPLLLDLAPEAGLEIDEEYIAGQLVFLPEPTRTPYKGFHSLKAGHAIAITEGRWRTFRYWHPDTNKTIRYPNDAQYEEHLRELLFEAVRVNLRTDGRPIWISLSGGLDSSSIVCIADKLVEQGRAEARQVDTFSVVYDESTTADERAFITAIEGQRGTTGFHLNDDEYCMRIPPSEEFLWSPSAGAFAYYHREALRNAMDHAGARVMIDGFGGDHVFWNLLNASPELADLLAQGKLLQLHRRLTIWSQALRKPYLQLLWKQAAVPLLPRAIRSRSLDNINSIKAPPWIGQAFAKRTHVNTGLRAPSDPYAFASHSQRIQSAFLAQAVCGIEAFATRHQDGIESRHPLLYRPLVEFLLAIPFEQKARPGETRSILRRALRDILPDKVCRRKTKGVIGEAIQRGLYRQRGTLQRLFKDARVYAHGYVRPDALNSDLTLALHGGRVNPGPLVNSLSIELWLRSLERHGRLRPTAVSMNGEACASQ
jgi:asparagine synthase (glutamine-hydrolysing)